ncbi:VWD domain-containing protein, partial [Salmonella sp. s54925]|uniref:VWD domain-containing protein n=1 Tax=Salmonella sp. s54925 TaxID=3159674 RepID=UPI00397F7D56
KLDFKDQNEVVVSRPGGEPELTIIRGENNKVEIKTSLGYIVEFGGGDNKVLITVDFDINSRTIVGLCGNHNGNKDDDFRTPDNEIAPDVLSFAKSWRTGNQCSF